MTNSNQPFVAFFSYVHRNDERDRGRLTELRKVLEVELWAQTGKDLQIFQDKEDIEWGDLWKEKITKALDASNFLIVIVTPGYLESQFCRFEFEYFLKKEALSKRKDLILPILYIDTAGLKDSKDPIAVEISKRQWVDWQDIRFASLTSAKTNKKLASLAKRIHDSIEDKGTIPAFKDKAITSKPEPKFKKNEDNTPPPPINFPDDWETQWQPSFKDAAFAAKPESKFKKNEDNTPPRVQLTSEENDALREAVGTSMPSIYIPIAQQEDEQGHPPKQITMILRSTGDKERDRRRIKTIYGTLISFHGKDRFAFEISKHDKPQLIDFPNDTTRVCPEMLLRLKKLMGSESWRIDEIPASDRENPMDVIESNDLPF